MTVVSFSSYNMLTYYCTFHHCVTLNCKPLSLYVLNRSLWLGDKVSIFYSCYVWLHNSNSAHLLNTISKTSAAAKNCLCQTLQLFISYA